MTNEIVTSRVKSIHPFPARMAPDLAIDKIRELSQKGDTVLDPMCGSGTVVATAQSQGRRAVACDLDPLAVMITRTACNSQRSLNLTRRAKDLVERASTYSCELPPWIASDAESREFVEFWFDEPQRRALSRIAKALAASGPREDPLRVALSRLIITKDGGASLARDTSHSRPHRTRLTNKFDVDVELIKSATRIESIMKGAGTLRNVSVRLSDARRLDPVRRSSVDLIVTSPPYLNAIDYMRGHRMSLIWFGYTLAELREARGTAIGSERVFGSTKSWAQELLERATESDASLSARYQGMVSRYISDMAGVARAAGRVLKPGGHLVFVVANSQSKGVTIDNALVCRQTAELYGLKHVATETRTIPAQHRYLPPPAASVSSALDSRMKIEYVITLRKAESERPTVERHAYAGLKQVAA